MSAREILCAVCGIDLGATVTLPDDATEEQWTVALSGYLCDRDRAAAEKAAAGPDWASFGREIYGAPAFAKLMTTSATNAFAILADQVATFNDESILLAMFNACRAGLSGGNVLDQSDIDSINALLLACNFTITVSL